MNEDEGYTLFWFRRDLRLEDNIGLQKALEDERPLLPVFIFDPHILEELEEKADPRVGFIHRRLQEIHTQLKEKGSGLRVLHEEPEEAFRKLTEEWDIQNVHCCRDHEPYARERDERINSLLEAKGIGFHQHDDQNLFPPERVRKDDGTAYKVFTPYKNKARKLLDPSELKSVHSLPDAERLVQGPGQHFPSLEELGFEASSIPIPSPQPEEGVVQRYHEKRDLPAEDGTTQLGVHLRFGTLSIREVARYGWELSESFLNELIWRDFFQTILREYPQVVDHAFKPEFDRIEWENDEEAFRAWCEGRTGYPMVDAGMRELSATGYMHNRCRMVTASFLTKHLLIDWRWGEAWFARKLLDYELASNNGNWQWAAGCGCDAAPYFRIFNPERQRERFDPNGTYVKKWVPEWGTSRQDSPIVEHKAARERALERYRNAVT